MLGYELSCDLIPLQRVLSWRMALIEIHPDNQALARHFDALDKTTSSYFYCVTRCLPVRDLPQLAVA